MVCACSNSEPNWLTPYLGNKGNLVLLGFVESTIDKMGRAWEAMNQQFKILIGNG